MSLVFAPPQHQKDGVPTVQRLLDENSRLIEDIKEQQNLGRAEEVLKRQQLLHRNLVYLAKLADQSLLAQLQPDGGGQQNANGEQQHSGQQRPSSNGENQAPMTPQMMSQNTVPPNGMPPPVPVPVPTPSHLLQPPTVQVTQHTLNGQPPPRGSPGSAMLSPGQQAAYYGASQQPSPGQRYAQAMNAPHGFPAPVQPQRIQSPMMSQAQGVPTTHPGMTHPSQQQHPGMPPHSMPSGMHPGLTMGQPPPMQGQPSPSQPGQMPHYYGQPPSSQAGYPGMPPQHMMQHPQMGQPGMAPGYPMPYPGQQMHPAYAQQQTPPTSQPQQGQQYMR